MKNVKTVLSWLIFYIGLVCVFFSLWGYGHWPHLDLDQLYFSMTSPVEGVGNHLLEKGKKLMREELKKEGVSGAYE